MIKHQPVHQDSKTEVRTESRKVFSVTEITRAIKSAVELQFPGIWVEGEISDFKHHTSGHMYFRLKDEGAVLDAVMFRGCNQMLRFTPKDGTQVLIYGKISVYEKRGNYQMYAERMEPKGIGALQLAFEQLKERLRKEGLFDESRKKPIPHLPRKIGIITSPTGAAIRDILNIVNRRFSNVHIIIHPVLVQGPDAAEDIAGAIDVMNKRADTEVLIVGRGGGSLEDLWAFNEEIVARALARSKIPIISAVGHEVDFTIADFVADLRAPTPSAAAELVIPEKSELESTIRSLRQRLENAIRSQWALIRERLSRVTSSYAFRQPRSYLNQMQQRLDDTLRHLVNQMKAMFESSRRDFKEVAVKFDALNPLSILKRGYSVTYSNSGNLVLKANELKMGETIKTRVFRGVVYSKVLETRDESE